MSFTLEHAKILARGIFSDRPIASTGRYWYFATDTGNLYKSNGTAWTLVASTSGGVASVFGRSGAVLAVNADYDTSLVPDTTNKRYVTDAELAVLAATSGANTGDQTLPIDSTITTTDNTGNDVSTSKHGWTPKAPNDTSKFLRADATWATPPSALSWSVLTNGDPVTPELIFAAGDVVMVTS